MKACKECEVESNTIHIPLVFIWLGLWDILKKEVKICKSKASVFFGFFFLFLFKEKKFKFPCLSLSCDARLCKIQ